MGQVFIRYGLIVILDRPISHCRKKAVYLSYDYFRIFLVKNTGPRAKLESKLDRFGRPSHFRLISEGGAFQELHSEVL